MNMTPHTISKTLEPGTISHGTMREEHLIPRFLAALQSVDSAKHASFLKTFAAHIRCVSKAERTARQDYAVGELLDVLFHELDEYCPDGHYFGSHPGDGSDFGVWPCEDMD
jgi:hypothetical protein